jgi:hypothetical protein
MLAAALTLVGGCESSQDSDTWVSTATQPKSVSVVAMPDGETLWTMDVPANHRLKTQVLRNEGDTTPPKKLLVSAKGVATGMSWSLEEAESGETVRERRVDLPGKPIKWSWTIREPMAAKEARPEGEAQAQPAEGAMEDEAEPMDEGGDADATQPEE